MTPTARAARRLAAATAVVGVLAACSNQEDATPATPATLPATTTPPTTAIPTTAPTTTVAPTTAPPTAPPPTTAPPTTAPPVPTGDPTDQATPIFAGSSNDAWLYLGRWDASGWRSAFDADGLPVPADLPEGTEVTIAELGQTPVGGTAGASGQTCFVEPDGAITGPIITPNAGVPDIPGFGYRAIALPAAWEVHPREAVEIDDEIQAYRDAGVAAFADDEVETQAGEVDQTVVSDLDGDGDTEVLVVFGHENERVEGQGGPAGGFSGLLLLDADSRDATTVVKSSSPLPDETNELQLEFDRFRVLDVADLNGDGIAEVVVHSWYGEGASVGVFAYDGETLREVLVAGCGV